MVIVKVGVFEDRCCTVWSVVKGSHDKHAMSVTLMHRLVALAPAVEVANPNIIEFNGRRHIHVVRKLLLDA